MVQDTLHDDLASDQQPPKFTILRGHDSPQVRVAAGNTGELTYATLRSCCTLPDLVRDTFTVKVRLSETDDAGSNSRAEASALTQQRGDWMHLHLLCMCHKVHSCAQRTFSLASATTSGIIHSCLQIATGGFVRRLREACLALVRSCLKSPQTP